MKKYIEQYINKGYSTELEEELYFLIIPNPKIPHNLKLYFVNMLTPNGGLQFIEKLKENNSSNNISNIIMNFQGKLHEITETAEELLPILIEKRTNTFIQALNEISKYFN